MSTAAPGVPAPDPSSAESASAGTTADGGSGSRLLGGRLVLGLVGLAGGLYGAYLLLESQRGDALVSAVAWLVGGVLVHDVLVAAVALVVGLVVTRLVPRRARGPLVVGLVVLGTVSVVAIPFVGRFGALPDNPTLLPRDYVGGYLLIVGLVVVGVVVGIVLASRRAARSGRSGRSRRGTADGGDEASTGTTGVTGP